MSNTKTKNTQTTSVDRILAAAEVEFGEHGLLSANIEDIALKAGVSSKLVYHYFSRKEHLYAETIKHTMGRFFDAYPGVDLDSENPLQSIYRFAYDYCAYFTDNPHIGRMILDRVTQKEYRYPRNSRYEETLARWYTQLADCLDECLRKGLIREGVDAQSLFYLTIVVTLGYTAMSESIDSLYLSVPELNSAEQRRRKVADVIISSISPLTASSATFQAPATDA